MVLGAGDGAPGAGLHPVGGLMGQGVPDGRAIVVHPADHDRAAGLVVQPLQALLIAIALHHVGAAGHQQSPQVVDLLPAGLGADWGRHRWGHKAARRQAGEQGGSGDRSGAGDHGGKEVLRMERRW